MPTPTDQYGSLVKRVAQHSSAAREVAKRVAGAPSTGHAEADARIASKVAALQAPMIVDMRKLLSSVAGDVARLVLEHDDLAQEAYETHVVSNAGGKLADLLAALDEQVEIVRWWIGAE